MYEVYVLVLIFSLFFRTIDVNEAKTLVYLLHSTKDSVVEKVITTISNLSTFAANQVCMCNIHCTLTLNSIPNPHSSGKVS